MKSLFVFVLLRWFTAAQSPADDVSSGNQCTFKGRRFERGSSWTPSLEPFGLMLCLRCLCTQSGHVKCNTIKCPRLWCEHPVTEPRHCCPRCSDQSRVPAGLRASSRSCRFNGSVFQSGETFTKHNNNNNNNNSSQCSLCTCSNGNIFCALKTCPPVSCSSPVGSPDTCCLLCKDQSPSGSLADDGNQQLNRGVRHSVDQCSAEQRRAPPPWVRTPPRGLSLRELNLRGASETSVKILLQNNQQPVCFYNGKSYSNGDTWHPVLGKLLECILCTCSHGLQSCSRIRCPAHYPCPHPHKTAGKCCSTCPESRAENNQTRCGGGNNVLVYKVETSLNVDTPLAVRVIAAERPSSTELEVHVWRRTEGVLHLMEIGDVQRKDVLDHRENYTLLATLDEDTWRRFKEVGGNLKKAPRSAVCQDGVRLIMAFLNPTHTHGWCSP